MSFLDRFQNKISTVTAQGHLKKADGSEEIRVGPPKRKHNGVVASVAGKSSGQNNNQSTLNSNPSSTVGVHHVEKVLYKKNPSPELSPRTKGTRVLYDDDDCLPGRALEDNDSPSYKVKIPTLQEEEKGLKSRPNQHAPSVRSHCSPIQTHREPQKECQSPRDRNESLAHTNDAQLAFSRKARPVQFAPCTLSQYKKEKPTGYYELGKLQPDLNADELVQKRANAERIKAFSKNLRGINKVSVPTKKVMVEEEDVVVQKKSNSTREKALEFAKRIPKPRLVQRPLAEPSGMLSNASSNESLQPMIKFSRPNAVDDESDDDDVSSELQELQMRHQASRAQVEALMRSS